MSLKKSDISYRRSVRLLNSTSIVDKTFYLEKLPKDLRALAFYIADLEKHRQLADLVRQTVVASAIDGLTYEEFADQFDQKVLTKISKARLKTIYRNNLSGASNSAKIYEARNSKVSKYLIYDAVDDEKTRTDHKALDGLVLKADDPRVNKVKPPRDHNCRCRLIVANKRQAEEVRKKDTNQFKTAEEKIRNANLDEGFGPSEYGDFSGVVEQEAKKALNKLPARSSYKQTFRSALAKIPFKVDNWYESVSKIFE